MEPYIDTEHIPQDPIYCAECGDEIYKGVYCEVCEHELGLNKGDENDNDDR